MMAGLAAAIVDCFALRDGAPSSVMVASTTPTSATRAASRDECLAWSLVATEEEVLLGEARRLGLARARSASAAAWMAMIVCAAARHTLEGRRVSLGVSSTTATETIAYLFERRGLELGWKVSDPFWLPNTIPSCVATAVFGALKLRGIALGFPGGLHGFFGALDHALVLLATGSVERAMVVTTEHDGVFRDDLAARANVPCAFTGAMAIVLEPTVGAGGECRLELAFGADGAALTSETEGSSHGAVESLLVGIGDADVPATEILRFRAGITAHPTTPRRVDFVARETGEVYRLLMQRLP